MNLRRFKIFVISRSVLSDSVPDRRPRDQTDNREDKQNGEYNQPAESIWGGPVEHVANQLAESGETTGE